MTGTRGLASERGSTCRVRFPGSKTTNFHQDVVGAFGPTRPAESSSKSLVTPSLGSGSWDHSAEQQTHRSMAMRLSHKPSIAILWRRGRMGSGPSWLTSECSMTSVKPHSTGWRSAKTSNAGTSWQCISSGPSPIAVGPLPQQSMHRERKV